MSTPSSAIFGLIGLGVLLLVFLVVRPHVTRSPEGKILAFLILVVAPSLAMLGGGAAHMERSKSTDFCLSCHVMEPYGKSLLVEDSEFLVAQHFQNTRVPREHACYTCHTDYAFFGGVRSKLRGLRHVAVQYFGTVPDTVKLYRPYDNRECLHCHQGARSFEESRGHSGEDFSMESVKSRNMSCLTAGCHDVAHGVHELDEAEFWKPGSGAVPEKLFDALAPHTSPKADP